MYFLWLEKDSNVFLEYQFCIGFSNIYPLETVLVLFLGIDFNFSWMVLTWS